MLVKWKLPVAAMFVAALAFSASADITVRFDPVNTVIPTVGGTALVDIYADIPEADGILAWGFDIDVAVPAIADWTFVSAGPLFNAGAAADGDNLFATAPPPNIPVFGTDILLATVQFQGLAPGLTAIGMSDDNPADLSEGFGLDPSGFATVIYQAGTVEVLPEPTSLLLLALGGFAALRRR